MDILVLYSYSCYVLPCKENSWMRMIESRRVTVPTLCVCMASIRLRERSELASGRRIDFKSVSRYPNIKRLRVYLCNGWMLDSISIPIVAPLALRCPSQAAGRLHTTHQLSLS